MAVDIIARAMAANASGGSKDVDYNSVINKPQINGVTLEGNKTTSDLGIGEIPSFIGTQDSPINLASNDIVKNLICFVSGYIPDNPSGYGYVFKSPIILLNTTNKGETWSDTGSKIQCLYEGYVKSGDSYSPLKVWTRTLEFNESTNSWKEKNGYHWKMTHANYLSIPFYTTLYKNYLFEQKGAYDMYRELMSYLTDTVSNKPLLSGLETTNKSSLINAINELVDTKQDKLTAGDGITIENNVISASGGKDVDYGSVTNKPQINGITLKGNKTTSDLGIGEIIELKGTKENPIELANIGEPGIYKISGYVKSLLTSSATDIGNDIILEVAKTYNAISQHYWMGNYAFRMKVRVTISGIPFTENFHELSQNGDIQNYDSINAYSLITSSTLSSYLGRGYSGKVLLTDLKTTDKKSLVNAINEINDKITSGTFVTNLAEVQGYDATKTQVLKNINGVLTWTQE